MYGPISNLVTAVYTDWVRPGDTVLDIGVNRGLHLRRLAEAVGPLGSVVGVEAVPDFMAAARASLHDELASRVTLHQCAVAAEPGMADFFVTSISDGGLSGLRMRPVMARDPFERITVETRTIDSLLPDGPIRFAKLDIEGGEYDALRGAARLLAQRPLIAFEFNEAAPAEFGYRADALRDLLRDAEYGVYDIFGFEADSGAAMQAAQVWNFLAIPPNADPITVTAPARRVLEQRIDGLATFAPGPPPAPEMIQAIRRDAAAMLDGREAVAGPERQGPT